MMRSNQSQNGSWLSRLTGLLSREPQDLGQLLHTLQDAAERHLFNADALTMIEGVLKVSEMCVQDIMIPKKDMVSLIENQTFDVVFDTMIQSKHSRFPVYRKDEKAVLGILHAKDILSVIRQKDPLSDLHALMRPTVFIPQNKRLDVLLKDFRLGRKHMAMVIDEFSTIVGLVTIEDVLEQIVGDIQDEFDDAEKSV